MTGPGTDEHDEYGFSFEEDYPDCPHGSDLDDGERCTICVPPGVREQRLIDADPEGYDAAVEAILALHEDDPD
jgi:hypothetical protein